MVSESGDDPDMVDQERAEDAARERDLGLPVSGLPDGVQQTATGDEVDQDAIDNDEYSAPPNPAGDGVRALVAETRKQATALAAKKAKAKLGWEAKTSLHELITMMVDADLERVKREISK